MPLSLSAPWIATGLVWAATALRVKRPQRIEPLDSRIGHLLTFAVAFSLLFSPGLRIGPLGWRVVPAGATTSAAGLFLEIAGAGIAIWARLYLGGNWSSFVEIKQNHQLIRRGPYAVVRHPIYAGLLLAMLGTAIQVGETGALLGVPLAFAGWLAKARLEDSFLLARFGNDFLRYRRQVKALVPFVM